jgi:hypothetical protein
MHLIINHKILLIVLRYSFPEATNLLERDLSTIRNIVENLAAWTVKVRKLITSSTESLFHGGVSAGSPFLPTCFSYHNCREQ